MGKGRVPYVIELSPEDIRLTRRWISLNSLVDAHSHPLSINQFVFCCYKSYVEDTVRPELDDI